MRKKLAKLSKTTPKNTANTDNTSCSSNGTDEEIGSNNKTATNDEDDSQSVNTETPNIDNLYRSEFVFTYNSDYIKYYEGVGYPKFAVDILESAPLWIEDAVRDGEQKDKGPAFEVCDVQVKIGDLGNACWVDYHYSEDIQTRQYRSPEVILYSGYGPSADIWSVACLAFELATGDYLFDPRPTNSTTRDEDHIARMMELLGPIPKEVIENGLRKRKFFDSQGRFLKRQFQDYDIYSLLVNNHEFPEPVANIFANFLESLLDYNPETRPTALECLKHNFILQDLNYSEIFEKMEIDPKYHREAFPFKDKKYESPENRYSSESESYTATDIHTTVSSKAGSNENRDNKRNNANDNESNNLAGKISPNTVDEHKNLTKTKDSAKVIGQTEKFLPNDNWRKGKWSEKATKSNALETESISDTDEEYEEDEEDDEEDNDDDHHNDNKDNDKKLSKIQKEKNSNKKK